MIDDELDLAEMFQELFTRENVHVRCYTDPIAASEALMERSPDLLFVDYRLPGITGDVLVERLNPTYPVILLTGDLEVNSDYPFWKRLEKQPFPVSEISAILEEMVRAKG